jgi:hypothetical protein
MAYDSLHAISSRIWEEIQGGWIYDDERINLKLIRDKVNVARAKIMGEHFRKRLYVDTSYYQQCCLDVLCEQVCKSPHKEFIVKLPQLIGTVGRKNIKFLGTVDRKVSFENRDSFDDFTGSIPFSGNASPFFTRVDNFAILKNLPTPSPKKLLLVAMLSNPLECDACDINSPYPVPGGEFISDIERMVMMDLSGFLVQRRIDKVHNANPDT